MRWSAETGTWPKNTCCHIASCIAIEFIGENWNVWCWKFLLQFQSGCQTNNTSTNHRKMHCSYAWDIKRYESIQRERKQNVISFSFYLVNKFNLRQSVGVSSSRICGIIIHSHALLSSRDNKSVCPHPTMIFSITYDVNQVLELIIAVNLTEKQRFLFVKTGGEYAATMSVIFALLSFNCYCGTYTVLYLYMYHRIARGTALYTMTTMLRLSAFHPHLSAVCNPVFNFLSCGKQAAGTCTEWMHGWHEHECWLFVILRPTGGRNIML